MNRRNKLFLVILSFAVSIMIGYALFSETVTISGTATSTGSFDIGTTCVKGVDAGLMNAAGITSGDIPEGGYNSDYCNVSGSNVSFGANLEFPSAIRYFTIVFTNNGTIPAKLNPETGIIDNITVCQSGNCTNFRDTLTDDQYNFIRGYYFSFEIIGFKNSKGQYVIDEDEMANFFDEDTGEVILKTGESLVVLASSFWDSNNPPHSETENSGDYQTIGVVNFNFVQVTD